MAKPGGDGLRGRDKQQAGLRGDGTYARHRADKPERRTAHQDAQQGADVRGQPAMNQGDTGMPEGLARPRKGPYDRNAGRNEDATQVPKNGTAGDEMGFPAEDESKWG